MREVFSLYKQFGEGSYIGEQVTQAQHALQAAHLAQKEGWPPQVVLGALLHDVGHLVGQRDNLAPMMTKGTTLGTPRHEVVGEEYLKGLGFPEEVTSFVRNHVEAKRFLVATDHEYYQGLSDASKMTLTHQGGPMMEGEVAAFKTSPHFKAAVRMRGWDEAAKDPVAQTPALEEFEALCLAYLKEAAKK